MTPKPYSDKSSLPTDSLNDGISGIPTEVLPQTPSPTTLSGATTPSPTPQEQVPVETFVDSVNIQDSNRIADLSSMTPCYPTPGDIMPYDHSLPDFIRQITNQPNLANLQSLSLRVISTLISLHRMSAYLPNLRELDLEGSVLNSLRDIGCSLKNLQILKVGRCQLESLDGTFGLPTLRELYAQKNFINDISPCSNLPHIRHIDVSGNRIRNISYAGFLSVCRKLKSIVFTGNPATEVSGYRNHVRRILPQVETLDGIPFINEDNTEETLEQDLIENCGEGSDSGSEVPDYLSVSPSDSQSSLSKSENFLFLDKKNKQAKNLASQDQSDSVDGELQDATNDVKTDQDECHIPNSCQVRKGFSGQAKSIDNRNVNLKQKCTSIQKHDKDIENRSKKSNLLLKPSLGGASQEFSKCHTSEENMDSSSTSTSGPKNYDSRKIPSLGEEMTGQPTMGSTSVFSIPEKADEIKYGVIKKTSTSSLGNNKDEKQITDQTWGMNTLTTGLPICGNLTAALRNRKKQQTCWTESQNVEVTETTDPPHSEVKRKNALQQNFETSSQAGRSNGKLEVHVYSSGDGVETDYGAANEDDLIGEDVLTTSKKWRQSFRRFRSNNRASWEEYEHEDKKGVLDLDDQTCASAENRMQDTLFTRLDGGLQSKHQTSGSIRRTVDLICISKRKTGQPKMKKSTGK